MLNSRTLGFLGGNRENFMTEPNWQNRTLFHGDNLDFLRAMNSESVDLIATDPPFNKGRDFHATPDSLASGAKFQDRWSWENDVHQEWVDQIKDDHPRVMNVVQGSRSSYGGDMGAFLCFMAVRLLAMRRVLKDTGSIYLHCDPTASHYLKQLMDAVFGRKNFRNEIVWKRKAGRGETQNAAIRFGVTSDVLLFYARSSATVLNRQYRPNNPAYIASKFTHVDHRGRRYRLDNLTSPSPRPNLTYEYKGHNPPKNGWAVSRERMKQMEREGRIHFPSDTSKRLQRIRFLDELPGETVDTLWDDIPPINSRARERMGYPTQKPLALYERIVKASSKEGDVVLDPFAGCATTCIAAERLKRQWVGIDIWDKAHETVILRLQKEGLAAPDGSTGGVALPFYGQIHYSKELPERTDDGETATVALETINRRELAAWQKLSHKDMVAILKEAQADTDNSKLVVCAGCGRKLEPEFMELDHITPKSEPHSTNDLSNRILLCRPCNGRKSNKLAMTGLRNANKKVGWMVDENLSKQAVTMAFNAYRKVRRQDS